MKILVVVFLLCLLITGTVSAKAADTTIGSSVVDPAISGSGINTLTAFTDCSDDSASVGTPVGMGELNVDSTPDGASVNLDGSIWYPYCGDGYFCLHQRVLTPYSGVVDKGTHSITIAKTGYKSYSGTVKICAQKVTYVDRFLTAIPTTTVTPTTTSATTTTATTTATTAAVTTTTAASGTTTATGTTTTSPVSWTAAPGAGSLTVTTTPAGAAVYIDGVQRGVSPAVIPGLAAGSHTIILKLNGYQDLSTPVSITAGTMNDYSTGLTPLPAGGTVVPAATTAGAAAVPAKTQSPGFETVAGIAAIGALLYLRKV